MKEYKKPIIIDEAIEIEDVIAASPNGDTFDVNNSDDIIGG